MSIHKYTDWRSWWDGLRTNLIKCIGTTGIAFIGSNGLANVGIPALQSIGLNWEQAVGFFGVHIAWEVFSYMKENQPKVIVEDVQTSFTSKNPETGVEITQASKKTVVTPVVPPADTVQKPKE